MASANGYVLILSAERYEVFSECLHEKTYFAQPVSEFSHSRNAPLLTIIVSGDMTITHIAEGRRGFSAGTGLRRLNITNSEIVTPPISLEGIVTQVPQRLKRSVLHRLRHGGLLSPKTFRAVVDALIALSPSLGGRLRSFGHQRAERIERLSEKSRHSLASQKLAISTAITLAGLTRDALQEWDPGPESSPASFLDGLTCARLREDPMVVSDLAKLPGYDLIKTMPYPAAVFQGDKAKLTVVLANRLPLEEQTGTDLIYFNETFRSFVMVQYKAMERKDDESVFRLPNPQLSKEVDRMNSLLAELRRCIPGTAKEGFRLDENPFYLKLCPRIVFNPDDTGLTPGMYIPLDYWNILCTDPSINGLKGGKIVSYKNVGRYLDNTEFVTLVSKAWIGTTDNQSTILEAIIRSTLEVGKALAIGVKTDIPQPQTTTRSDKEELTMKGR